MFALVTGFPLFIGLVKGSISFSLSYISHTDNVIAFRKEPCPLFIYGSFGFVRLLFLYTCSLRR